MPAYNQPLVTVVIASHNCVNYIDLCVNSIINQSYVRIEIIICDDASNDGTYEKLCALKELDSRIRLLRNDLCMKAAYTRNRCIQQGHGDYFLIQDADDYSSNERVSKLVSSIMSEKVDFVSSGAYYFSKNPYTPDALSDLGRRSPCKYDFLWGMPFAHACTMFSRECLLAVSGYRVAKETSRGQDYDLFMRLYANGFKGINIPDRLYWIRRDESYYKRRLWSTAVDEYIIRKKGFKMLKLMPLGYFFAFKPYLAFILYFLMNLLHHNHEKALTICI
jgi:glycosyltransferase involved in cell wall biosynthesis